MNVSVILKGMIPRTKHDAREYTPANTDEKKEYLNEYVGNADLSHFEDFINDLYSDEIKEYNEKNRKKHPERCYTNFAKEKIEKYAILCEKDAKNGENSTYYQKKGMAPIRQGLLQFGDKDNHPDPEIFNKIAEIYMNGSEKLGIKPFEERNPGFHVMAWNTHNDEATPHLNYYIAFKAEKENGLTKRFSFENTLKNMGFELKRDPETNRRISAIEQWNYKERETIKTIAKALNIEYTEPENAQKRTQLTVSQYKAEKAKENYEKDIKNIEKATENAKTKAKEEIREEYKSQKNAYKANVGKIKAQNSRKITGQEKRKTQLTAENETLKKDNDEQRRIFKNNVEVNERNKKKLESDEKTIEIEEKYIKSMEKQTKKTPEEIINEIKEETQNEENAKIIENLRKENPKLYEKLKNKNKENPEKDNDDFERTFPF